MFLVRLRLQLLKERTLGLGLRLGWDDYHKREWSFSEIMYTAIAIRF